jgi:flavin-binding protein dodecin
MLAETKVKISLVDAMSPGLNRAKRSIDGIDSSSRALGPAFASAAGQAAGLVTALTGLYGLADMSAELIKRPFEFAKGMETNSLGIAGILQSMTELNGKQLEWNQAMSISQGILRDLNDAALRTAATSEDLVEAFRALLGPGLAAGMDIDQLKEFTTVGVNAVKSLGLPRNQIVQELRDLVQGGIRPQSSTLAVALGLTDADIAAAKASSEGLFDFLMKRMKGFERSSLETPKTMAGLMDQISEGYTRSAATGTEELYNYYKETLAKVADLFLDQKSFELNPDAVSSMAAFSEHVVNAAKGIGEVGEVAGNVAVPAVKTLGTGLAFVADNIPLIAGGIALWKFGSIATDIYQVTANTNGAYQAQSLLGGAVQRTLGFYRSGQATIMERYQVEMQMANQAANAMQQAHNRVAAAARNRQIVENAVAKLTTDGYNGLAVRIQSLNERYKLMGATAEQAGKMQYQAAQMAAKGQRELAVRTIEAQEKHLLAARAAKTQAERYVSLYNKAIGLGSTLAVLGGTISMVSDESDNMAQSLGSTAFQAGIAISAIGTLIGQLGKLVDAYNAVKIAGVGAGLLTTAGVVGAGAIGIGLGVGAAAVGVYGAANGLSVNDFKERYTSNPLDKEIAKRKEANRKFLIEQEALKKQEEIDTKQLTLRDFGGTSDKAKKGKTGKSQAERDAEKALKELTKYQGKIAELSQEVNRKIIEQTGTSFDVANASLAEEIEKMNSTISKAQLAGVDPAEIAKVEGQIEKYKDLQSAQNYRDYLSEKHGMDMDYYQTLEDTHSMHISQINDLRISELEEYRNSLQKQLEDTELTEKEKLRLKQEYAAATKDLQDAQSADLTASWRTAMDEIKNLQYDQLGTMRQGLDDVLGTFTNFGQNMLTEQKSLSEMSDQLFKDLANSIMNTMMKVIMQGLVMNMVTSMFGMGGGNVDLGGILSHSSYFSIGGTKYSGSSFMGGLASGGYAPGGMYLVGEKGPELLDLNTPGRVYTAEQTRAALNGGNAGIQNIEVNITNESGQPVQAAKGSATFDGERLVLGIVLKAVQNNEGGFRDVMRSAVTTY